MVVQRAWIAAIGSFLLLSGCTTASQESAPGRFSVSQLSSHATESGEQWVWLAVAERAGGTTRFQIELMVPAARNDSPFSIGQCVIRADPSSHAAPFLEELATALQARSPGPVERTSELRIAAAILGTRLSRTAASEVVAGAFSSQPGGPWIATKLFLADGEAEVFLNLNSHDGIGEFAIKDPEYGDDVLRELARVL